MMKANEVRKLSSADLEKKLTELKKDLFQLRLQRSNILHSAGGLHVDQLATAAFGGARIPAIAGGRGDVCPANGGGKRDVNVGRIDG